MHVADILATKGTKVVTVRPELSIEQLVQRLRAEGIGAAVVSGNDVTVDGIISERDIVRALAEHGAAVTTKSVAELMTRAVVTCSPDDAVSLVSNVMTRQHIRHLPVTEGSRLTGIVSIGDVVRHRLDALELETNVLRDYAVSRH